MATAFPQGTITNRPKVALTVFTMLLGDIMRNLRVDKAPKTVASAAASPAASQQQLPQTQAGAAVAGGVNPATKAVIASTNNNNGGSQILPESTESVFRILGVDVGMRSVAHIADIA